MPRWYGSLKKRLLVGETPNFQTGLGLAETSEDDEKLRPHLWSKQSSCLTVSCLEWRVKIESDAAWHKLKVTGKHPLIRFFATASRMTVHNSSEEMTSGCKSSLLDIQR
jgi:hypothetical protein